MNNLAALIMIVMAGGHPADARSDVAWSGDARATTQLQLAQASTPPPGPMSPPSVGAPAPTPKIDSLPEGPPLGSLSLSQLMLKIEGEPEFAYVRNVAWRDGKYAVTYVTRDGQAHEKTIDPRTGRPTGTSQNGSTPPATNPTGTPSSAPTTGPHPPGPRAKRLAR